MNRATAFPVPPVVTIMGRSMEPTLRQGWQVRIEECADTLDPGEIVLLQGNDTLIVHRVVHCSTGSRGNLVFHRGDCEGGVGVARGVAVLGRVTAVLDPFGARIPGLEEVSPGFRRRFRWLRARCRLYSALRGLWLRSGAIEPRRGSWIAGISRRLLLGH